MQKWEYLIVYITDTDLSEDQDMDRHLDADHFTEKLNAFGDAGWELVSFDWSTPEGAKAAFKRPSSK